jgi:DNA-binding HxlR family transcriptional regulator
MDKKKHTPPDECLGKLIPVRDALDVFQGKWKIQIMSALVYYETCSFKLLKETVEGITPKMLSKELKELEMHKLVDREVESTRPVTIRYIVTQHGKTCIPVIKALYDWGQLHRKEMFG